MKQTLTTRLFLSILFLVLLTACSFEFGLWPKNPLPLSPSQATVSVPSLTPEEDIKNGSENEGTGTSTLKIGQIQGKQHRSPYDGKRVSGVIGVVTVTRSDGFFLQDHEPDGDPHTSDAVFVKTSGNRCNPKAGDFIRLASATVREYNPAGIGENSLTITNLVTNQCNVLEKDYSLPAPIVIGEGGRIPPDQIIDNDTKTYVSINSTYDPDEDGIDFYESLEGMLVQVNDAVAVSTINGYRNVSVVGDGGRLATVLSKEGKLVTREGDFNPERLLLDDDFIVMPKIRVGAEFTESIIGIIDYNFGEFNLEPIKPLKFEQGKAENLALSPKTNEQFLSVVSYNVENLDRVARPDRIRALGVEVVEKLASPDIIALQEVLDDDGVMDTNITSADESLADIIEAIKRAGGPPYNFVNIDPVANADGGVPGGNIRPVLLYRSDISLHLAPGREAKPDQRISIQEKAGKPALSHNPGRLGIGDYFFNASRKPLVAEFVFGDENFFIVNVHLKSKREDGPLYGDVQPPPLETEKQRLGQAALIGKTVEQILAIDPQAKVILLGDLNDYPWSKTLATLKNAGLVNLIESLPESERFTYSHSGMGQVLDHIVVSQALQPSVEDFQILHLNSIALPDRQLSDHDPVSVWFDFSRN